MNREQLAALSGVFYFGYYLTNNLCEIYTEFCKVGKTLYYVTDSYGAPNQFEVKQIFN